MRKVKLLKALQYSFAKRWAVVGGLPLGGRRSGSGIFPLSELDFFHAENFLDSSGRRAYSNNVTNSKLCIQTIRTSRQTPLFASIWNNRICRHYSSAPGPNAAVGGIVPIPLAQTGEGIADCELLRWFVKEGDEIDEFQPLCEVQSDKASVEITSRYKGKVTRVLHLPGAIIKVGETLLELMIEADHNSSPTLAAIADKHETIPANSTSSSPASGQDYNEIHATPAVRALAKVYAIDLASVPGTGKDGRVLKDDVIKFASVKQKVNEDILGISTPTRGTEGTVLESSSDSESDDDLQEMTTIGSRTTSGDELPVKNVSVAVKPLIENSPDKDQIIPVRGFRRIMAKTMTAAVAVPHFHYTEDIEVNSLVHLKNSLKDMPLEKGVKLTYLPFLIKALSLALLKYPIINSTVNQDVTEIHVHASHNVGIGMASSSGLVVPNIKNVQNLSVLQIAEELSRLTQLAATNKLSNEDLTGGTITVSNVGSIGGKYGSPILSLPEVAIVAIGKIQELPRYDADGTVYPASIMGVTWGADHRVIDGATVASFCNQWKLLIEQPGRFLLNMR